ncbi:prepilin-type N-terminal cleavage/methylation domain-containing protein [bacterium]|nr:prepilin-type N-terminal cleavage/methylation domain-containing protein [bacterium]
MSKRLKGFTLIELLVVIVIIGVLVAIALPNFLKIKDKAKEAEVKSNLHSIQLSLERYSTDNEGLYPFYLYGGDPYYNAGSACFVYGQNYGVEWQANGGNQDFKNPFDTFTYNDPGDVEDLFYGDPLCFEGYLTKFPRNPFVGDSQAWFFGANGANSSWSTYGANYAGAGGSDGKLMFCLSLFGEGAVVTSYDYQIGEDAPEYVFYPGNFWYHPRFQDEGTNADHMYRQGQDTEIGYANVVSARFGGSIDTQYDIMAHDVSGYDLGAVGSGGTGGMDVDYTCTGPYGNVRHRTCYIVHGQERNPYWAKQADNVQYGQFTQPDGISDGYIIYLNGGLDAKPGGTSN